MKWNFIFAGYLKEFSLLAAATHVRCEFVNMCINISICLHSLFCRRSSMANFPCGASSRLEVRGSPHAPGTPWVAQSLGATSCRIRRDVACCDLFLLKTGHSNVCHYFACGCGCVCVFTLHIGCCCCSSQLLLFPLSYHKAIWQRLGHCQICRSSSTFCSTYHACSMYNINYGCHSNALWHHL